MITLWCNCIIEVGLFFELSGTTLEVEAKLPAGHSTVPSSGQAVASKCPFLAAEMGQKNSSVVRQVGMEFQEDVQEVRTVQKGEIHFRNDLGRKL